MHSRICSSPQEVEALHAKLKTTPCPHCKSVGSLIRHGFLRGYEQPALYERVPDMRRFGVGAEVAWSFDFGDNEKKVQHILGGTFVDPRMTLGSNGTGVA